MARGVESLASESGPEVGKAVMVIVRVESRPLAILIGSGRWVGSATETREVALHAGG